MYTMKDMLRRAVVLNANGPAIHEADRSYTWLELATRVRAVASELISRGFKKGDRMAILSLNSARYFECSSPYCGAEARSCRSTPASQRARSSTVWRTWMARGLLRRRELCSSRHQIFAAWYPRLIYIGTNPAPRVMCRTTPCSRVIRRGTADPAVDISQ